MVSPAMCRGFPGKGQMSGNRWHARTIETGALKKFGALLDGQLQG
jgi:hypothetical protein